jgi:hypothetical protein
MKTVYLKGVVVAVTALLLSGCFKTKPFQPPPHPASLWKKDQSTFIGVLSEMKNCGWIEPKESVREDGKIDINRYAGVELCMLRKGFTYIGSTPLLCLQIVYRDSSRLQGDNK